MRVWKQGCDITRTLIGYVLSDASFDWLVGNMSVYEENLFQSRIKKSSISVICRIILKKYFIKATEDFFSGGFGRILDSYANPRLRLEFT